MQFIPRAYARLRSQLAAGSIPDSSSHAPHAAIRCGTSHFLPSTHRTEAAGRGTHVGSDIAAYRSHCYVHQSLAP